MSPSILKEEELSNSSKRTESPTSEASPGITRYAICGLSIRGIYHFVLPLLGRSGQSEDDALSLSAKVVGIYDLDKERVDCFLAEHGLEIPYFSTEEGVDAMIRETKPDVLLVAGPDYTHCEHILEGLRHGLRVIAEKPAVINCEEVRKILKAERMSCGSLTVAHNFRFSPLSRQVKKLIVEGQIGKVTNIEFVYNLDTSHGASYFYRWNRERQRSGGLSIHKSVHHLDFISWLVDSPPETVFAFGALNYYGANGAHRPSGPDGASLSLAETRQQCPYFTRHHAVEKAGKRITPGGGALNLPYNAQYPADGYIYDEEIDIEDTYSAVIRYRNGVSLAYSCNFSTPWEGYTLGINGTHGRIEISHHSDPTPSGLTNSPSGRDVVVLMPLFGGRTEYIVEAETDGHGGADSLLRRHLFVAPDEEDGLLGLHADSYAGGLAIAAGEAMWRSGKDGKPYQIRDLLGDCYRS